MIKEHSSLQCRPREKLQTYCGKGLASFPGLHVQLLSLAV